MTYKNIPVNRKSRIEKVFDRHFDRKSREVVIYGSPNRVDCPDCETLDVGPLGGAINTNCETCNGAGVIEADSSTVVWAIVTSNESNKNVRTGEIQQVPAGSMHPEGYVITFRLSDILVNKDTDYETTRLDMDGSPIVGWGTGRYRVDRFAVEGYGFKDFYVKAIAYKDE